MANKKEFEGIDTYKHGKLQEFLTSVKSMDIAGKKIIQLPDGEFIEYVLMEEEYFVDNWLSQFAIGFVNGHNYFDQAGWYKLTDGFIKGVIVLNENKEPVVVVRKFIDMDMNVNNMSYLEQYTRQCSHVAHNPNKEEVDAILGDLTSIIGKLTEQNPEYDTLTMMIPWEYYLSKGVNPTVMKQVIYMRDNFKYKGVPVSEDEELVKQIEVILNKNGAGEKLAAHEKELIKEISGNTFIFNSEENTVETKPSEPEKEFDPLSD